jgi:hypothetical protein
MKIFLFLLIIFIAPNLISAEILITEYTIVTGDLNTLNRKVHFSSKVDTNLSLKLDNIVKRVAAILKVDLNKISKVNIELLPSGENVQERFNYFYNIHKTNKLEAFYIPHLKLIYVSLIDVDKRIIAHEITHHLLFSLAAPPPSYRQEEIAHYVEERL